MILISEVRNVAFCHAEHYLENAGEFYPFGVVVSVSGEIKPVSASTGEEFPDSEQLISILSENLINGINSKEFIGGAIVVDVNIKSTKTKNTLNAIEIRFLDSNNKSFNCYKPYVEQNGDLFYQEILEVDGTLSL